MKKQIPQQGRSKPDHPHPATILPETLLRESDSQRLRRGGPGGQHRNKVETAIVLTHRPTGIKAEANERRSQQQNHTQALYRLRIALALQIRTHTLQNKETLADAALFATPALLPEISELWKSRNKGKKLIVSETHDDYPALLCEALDILDLCQYEIPTAANHLNVSNSQLVKFLKKTPAAFQQVNLKRHTSGLKPLR